MHRKDITEAVALVGQTMNPLEAQYARESLERHFTCKETGKDDGRHYFLVHHMARLVGLSGLHHWALGPTENVWLGWFAVALDSQRSGVGTWLLAETEQRARELGFK